MCRLAEGQKADNNSGIVVSLPSSAVQPKACGRVLTGELVDSRTMNALPLHPTSPRSSHAQSPCPRLEGSG